MKFATNIIVAVSCFALAGALVWTSHRGAPGQAPADANHVESIRNDFSPSVAQLMTSKATDDSSEQITKLYINVRPLVEELLQYSNSSLPKGVSPYDRNDMVKQIIGLISPGDDGDAAGDHGGGIGTIRDAGGVLIITDTPENTADIRSMLERLHVAMHSDDLRPIVTAVPTIRRPVRASDKRGATPLFTECLNIRRLLTELRAQRTHNPLEAWEPSDQAVAELQAFLINTVAPETWRVNGGKLGEIRSLGCILSITQTAENLDSIHATLAQLHHAATTDLFNSNRPAK